MTGKPGEQTQIYTSFIDVLFGVIVATSFIYPISPFEFKTYTTILAYATVVASWVGYHQAFLKRSEYSIDLSYVPRFVIDLILIYLYFYLINSNKDFPLMLEILPIIFGFYVLWELSRGRAQIRKNEVKRQIKLNSFFFILFLIQSASYFLIYIYGHLSVADLIALQYGLWITSMIMIILYRVPWYCSPSISET